ncbi:MAG: alanine/glycine:cation symporter family protein [Candidatus Zixiibacteriota bacterium]
MDQFMIFLDKVNDVLWADAVLYVLLFVGVLFTIWSTFGQYRALTHGVAVIRGKYDLKTDPGVVNHFQALSTALSATVGLGNIAGVAIAVSLGGPGAVFWMWVTGLIGMALKMTEVTQAMLYRNVDEPDKPKGGAMWVCKRGLARINPSLAGIGTIIGGLFCITLLISTVTGGNMFQAWNVADITRSYFGVPKIISGLIMMILVGLVIIGGIKRIATVAGMLVPFMCVLYVLAGLFVIVVNIERVPDMFRLIFEKAFSSTEATGAFIGGTAGYAFLKGMQRALFSNEAGQGSAPIAHSAAKTDEPVREGVVAGLGPFIDTLCVCTITAIVIMLTGVWKAEAHLRFVRPVEIVASETAGEWTLPPTEVRMQGGDGDSASIMPGQEVFTVVITDDPTPTGMNRQRLFGKLTESNNGGWVIVWNTVRSDSRPSLTDQSAHFDLKGATLTATAYNNVLPGLGYWIVMAAAWLFAISTMISWSYYGEQGVIYLLGNWAVYPYRTLYCILIPIASSPLIATQDQLDMLSTLGTGVMLWVNIPVMLIFGRQAMREYHSYIRRWKNREF